MSVENEQADARRDSQICLAKPNFQAGVNGDTENFPWSVDHVNRIGNLPVDFYSAILCYDKNKNNNNNYCCSVYPQLPPVIGAPWGYYGRGFLFPVDFGSVGVQLT